MYLNDVPTSVISVSGRELESFINFVIESPLIEYCLFCLHHSQLASAQVNPDPLESQSWLKTSGPGFKTNKKQFRAWIAFYLVLARDVDDKHGEGNPLAQPLPQSVAMQK